jgi:hypothetical protein
MLTLISDVNVANENLIRLLRYKHLTIVKREKYDVMEINRGNENLQNVTFSHVQQHIPC